MGEREPETLLLRWSPKQSTSRLQLQAGVIRPKELCADTEREAFLEHRDFVLHKCGEQAIGSGAR